MLKADGLIAISLTVAAFAGAWLCARAVTAVAARWRAAQQASTSENSVPWLWRVMVVLSAPLAVWLGPRLSLGLREQICRDEGGIRGLVSDHQNFGGAGRQIECRAGGVFGDDLLGRRDPGRTGADDFVDLGDGFGAISHGRNGLRTTRSEYFGDSE